MLLQNLHHLHTGTRTNISVLNGKIEAIGEGVTTENDSMVVYFENAIVFPGLINSHDHLDFNLFPTLGNRVYDNYVEWGKELHEQHKDAIKNTLAIPLEIRTKWGVYKNLLNGVTTVVNHGERLDAGNDIITVHQDCYSLHSVQNEKHWRYKLNHPVAEKWPYVIHTGEGTDARSAAEIDTLIKWNIFKRDIVGVHGIAMNEQQAASFKALVWCPFSNYFLNGKTMPYERLKDRVKVVFGTDSTLSSDWNLWEHIRLATKDNKVTGEEMYNMLTTSPAEVWGLPNIGKLEVGYDADIVVARGNGANAGMDALFTLNPQDILMVIHKGQVRLFDEALLGQLNGAGDISSRFSKVYVNGSCKYIYGDLPGLMDRARTFFPNVNFPVQA